MSGGTERLRRRQAQHLIDALNQMDAAGFVGCFEQRAEMRKWAEAALADSPTPRREPCAYCGGDHFEWDCTAQPPESAAPAPSSEAGARYFATGYTKEDLRAMHPNVKIRLQNGEDVVVDAKFDHYGVGSQNEETAYLIVGSETVVFPAKFVRERTLAEMPPAVVEPSAVGSSMATARLAEAKWWRSHVLCGHKDDFYDERIADIERAVAMNDETPQQLPAMPPAGQGAPKRG